MKPTYTIRITEPENITSVRETQIFSSIDETDEVVTRLMEKLHFNGIRDYAISIIDQSTGATVRTTRRITHPIPVEVTCEGR